MANIAGLYNPEAEAQQDFAPLPTGEYLVQIVDSDLKPTRNNAGHYLELTFEVIDGAHKGRKHWERLNLYNQNVQAVEIANRAFSAIREATGVLNPRDSQELHYKPIVIRVESFDAGSTRKNGQVRDRAESDVRAYKKAEGAQAFVGPTATPAQPVAKPAPWAPKQSAA